MARINASELLAAGIMALGRVHVPYLYKRQSDLKFHLRGPRRDRSVFPIYEVGLCYL
jgi:hypothetical protein